MNQQKLKLLYLMKLLLDETDPTSGLTMAQILEKLQMQGITAERKSIYRDLEALRSFGLAIDTLPKSSVEYCIAKRDFDLPELMLLVDAVQSSRFLTGEESDRLVQGLKRLASRGQAQLLNKHLYVEGRISAHEESVFSNVDRIQEGLATHRKLAFCYFKYDERKRRVIQHGGMRYVETPITLIYADGFYYLLTYNEKHDTFLHYRVDRMDNIEVLSTSACRNERIATYQQQALRGCSFGMYQGDPISTALWVSDEAMGAIIDRFGKDVQSIPQAAKCAHVYVQVIKSPAFFGWISQFEGRIRIKKPLSLAREYQRYLKAILAAYQA